MSGRSAPEWSERKCPGYRVALHAVHHARRIPEAGELRDQLIGALGVDGDEVRRKGKDRCFLEGWDGRELGKEGVAKLENGDVVIGANRSVALPPSLDGLLHGRWK